MHGEFIYFQNSNNSNKFAINISGVTITHGLFCSERYHEIECTINRSKLHDVIRHITDTLSINDMYKVIIPKQGISLRVVYKDPNGNTCELYPVSFYIDDSIDITSVICDTDVSVVLTCREISERREMLVRCTYDRTYCEKDC